MTDHEQTIQGLQIIIGGIVAAVPPTLMAIAALNQSRKNGKQTTAQTETLLKVSDDNKTELGGKTDQIHGLVNSRFTALTEELSDAKADREFLKRRVYYLQELLQQADPALNLDFRMENHKVLVIDDDSKFAFLVAGKCEQNGYVAKVVGSMAAAWKILLENGGFDVVFLDLTLPDSSVEDLLGVVRKIKPHAGKIVICTGDNNPMHKAAAVGYGAAGMLYKDDPKFDVKLAGYLNTEGNKAA